MTPGKIYGTSKLEKFLDNSFYENTQLRKNSPKFENDFKWLTFRATVKG